MTLEPGTTLGRYQILAPLGHGGMATVYKAFQPGLERVVALKVLRPAYVSDPEFLERFRTEARAIARLRHPHIVQVFDFAEEGGQVFLAMEFIEGGTLKARLLQLAREGQALPPREVTRIVGEIAEALAVAHAQGIVHRDVKPSNVMLGHDGKAVVTDFGIAKILAAAGQTQTGVGIGTPEYMSPEQGQGHSVDQRSDIYSLGVLAYELLAGRVPFSADTPLAVMLAHVRDPLPLPSRVNPAIGSRTERVLLRALAKDPAARYESAPDLAEALKAAVAEEARGHTARTAAVAPARAVVVARGIPRLRIPRLPTAALVALAILAAASLGSGASFVAGLIGASAPGASLAPIATAPLTLAPPSAPAAAATPRSTVTSSPAGAPAQPTPATATATLPPGATIGPTALPATTAPTPLPTPAPPPTQGAALPTATLPPATPVPTSPPTPTPIDQATARYRISGRVISAVTSVALASVRVSLFPSGLCCAPIASATTDGSGNYTLRVEPGAYRISYSISAASGYVNVYYWPSAIDVGTAAVVTVGDRDITGMDIRYPTGFVVSGVVTSASTGTPVANAFLVVRANDSHVMSTGTDASGRYSMRLVSGMYRVGFFKACPCFLGDVLLDLAVSGQDVTLNAQVP